MRLVCEQSAVLALACVACAAGTTSPTSPSPPANSARDSSAPWPECPANSTLRVVEFRPRITKACAIEGGALHGPSLSLDSDGRIIEQGQYWYGQRHGTWKSWDKERQAWRQVRYHHGSPLEERFIRDDGVPLPDVLVCLIDVHSAEALSNLHFSLHGTKRPQPVLISGMAEPEGILFQGLHPGRYVGTATSFNGVLAISTTVRATTNILHLAIDTSDLHIPAPNRAATGHCAETYRRAQSPTDAPRNDNARRPQRPESAD
jgi:hypothetical protein